MIYYFWSPSFERIKFLKSIGYREVECKTCDREVLKVDTDNKTFEVVHKHDPESIALISDFTKVLFEED